MGKPRIIAETGAGQHGVATATVCAKFGLKCVVYMGYHDVERQAPNVFRMKLLGAEVVPVTSGRGTLKDAMNDALRDWVTNVEDTFYCIGTVAGPHPYPAMVRDFQAIIGKEAKEQMLQQEGRFPDTLIAAIGGGSNAMGLFYPFLDDKEGGHYRCGSRWQRASMPRWSIAPRSPVAVRAYSMATAPFYCRTMTARFWKGFRFQLGSIIRALVLNMHGCTKLAALQYVSITDVEALGSVSALL